MYIQFEINCHLRIITRLRIYAILQQNQYQIAYEGIVYQEKY